MQALYEKIEVGEHKSFPGPVIMLWARGVLDVIPVSGQDIIALGEACRAYTPGHQLTTAEATRA